ncbi:MAG TPA: hypothetical protein VLH19_05840 [Patescibacteria group bacterium]|nr:hypothetical protein [Patescibacteria group bacterium]
MKAERETFADLEDGTAPLVEKKLRAHLNGSGEPCDGARYVHPEGYLKPFIDKDTGYYVCTCPTCELNIRVSY